MKGVVFVELLSMAESLIGEDAVDDVLDGIESETGGAYSSVGNYPCSELMMLVEAFSNHTGHSVSFLQTEFGKWIFNKFKEDYGTFFEGKADAFGMLETIEDEVHVEVRKLYPEAELPTLMATRINDTEMEMVYSSERPLVDFCQGMIQACMDHFEAPANIDKEPIQQDHAYGARFRIRLAAPA